MLNRMKLENFKAWREADLNFGKVTGFFGTNSSGKSSLIQFLLLLKQTRNATDRGIVLDFGGSADMVNLGTFADVVHRHDDKARIRWLLEWRLPKSLKIQDPMNPSKKPLFSGERLGTQCEVGLKQTRLWPYRLAYQFDGTEFSLQSRPDSADAFDLATDNQKFRFVRTQGRPWRLPHPVKTHLFPKQVRNYYQNSDFLSDFELEYENRMDSLYYLGPLREYPKREYHWAGSSPEDVGQRGERTVDAILAATRDRETRTLGYRRRRKRFQEMIAYWLNHLGLIHGFSLEEIGKGTNLYRAMVETSPQQSVDVIGRRWIRCVPDSSGTGATLLRPGTLDGTDGTAGDPSPSRCAKRTGRRPAQRGQCAKRPDSCRESQRALDAAPATSCS